MMRTGNSAQAWQVNSFKQQDAKHWAKTFCLLAKIMIYETFSFCQKDDIWYYTWILCNIRQYETYWEILRNTEHNMHMRSAFHRIIPSFTYHPTTPGPKSTRNKLCCHFTAWSRISTGNVPFKIIGATISIGNGSSVSSTHSWQLSTVGNLTIFHPRDIFNLCHRTETNSFH